MENPYESQKMLNPERKNTQILYTPNTKKHKMHTNRGNRNTQNTKPMKSNENEQRTPIKM